MLNIALEELSYTWYVALLALIIGGLLGYLWKIRRFKILEKRLAVTQEKVAENVQLKLEFLANMSREIRTPLNGVIGMTNLLRGTNLDAEQRSYANTVGTAADSLLDLLNDILDYSKITAGGMALEYMSFDLEKLAAEIMTLLGPKAREKGVDLILRYGPNAPRYVIGDSARIHQVLFNLSSNALKYTQTGHVQINIDSDDVPGAALTDNVIFKISVEDTGSGMTAWQRAHLCDKFSQSKMPKYENSDAENSSLENSGDSSLGLSLSQEFVEMMGGKILVKSRLGQGSVFSFDLKLERDVCTENLGDVQYDIDLTDIRILVVDGHPTSGEMMEEQLLARKLDADSAKTGEDAINMLICAAENLFPFDLVMIIHSKEGLNGYDLARQIKNNEALKEVGMLLISESLNKESLTTVEELGFSGFLESPVGGSEIFHALSAMVYAKQNNHRLPLITRQILRQENPNMKEKQKDGEKYQGVQVLLVEDNSFNQMVTKKILTKFGFIVTPASDGEAAVVLTQQRNFDIILMDCEMPGMDGYDATKLIIEHERAAGLNHTPIIAFTANAMGGDEQKCFAAGMDDYISKPVEPDMMFTVMSRWLTEVIAARDKKAKALRQHQQETLIDPEVLVTLKSLTEESFIPVLESYIIMASRAVSLIGQALKESDIETLKREAHSLKSSSRQVGAMEIGDLSAQIEDLCRQESYGDIQALYPVFTQSCERVAVYLQDYIAPLKSSEAELMQ